MSPDRRLREGAVLLLVALAAWWPSFDNGYSLDDYNWLAPAHFQGAGNFVASTDGVELWTPISSAFFWSLDRATGGRPVGFRVALFACHWLTALVLLRLLQRLGAGDEAALAGAALFAGHAAGSEALFWIAAFQHVLATLFGVGALLAFVTARQDASRRAGALALLAFLCGVLSKAPYASVLLALAAAALWTPRVVSRAGGVFAFVVVVAVAVPLAVRGATHSYLVDRGAYALGAHVPRIALVYAMRLLWPFPELCARVGIAWAHGPCAFVLTLLALPTLAMALWRGPAGVRVLAALTAAVLLPFLLFTWAPTSRYAYAASVGACGLLGWLLVASPVPRTLGRAALAALLLASAFEIRLEDNVYEYRERQSDQWIADVRAAFPTLRRGARLAVLGLPRIAIDTGLHLEAALRLAYDDPALSLAALERFPPSEPGFDGLLGYTDGRLRGIAGR